MNRQAGTTAPCSSAMSSNRMPLSGMSMSSACCMARDVSPIFQPMTRRPCSRFARWIAFRIAQASSMPVSGWCKVSRPVCTPVRSACSSASAARA